MIVYELSDGLAIPRKHVAAGSYDIGLKPWIEQEIGLNKVYRMSETKLREYENFHIVLWLLKDTCWLLEFKLGGMIMIVPTVLAAFHITWLGRKNTANLFHNLAVSNWICGNAVWMIGEFFFDDTLRPIAKMFFGIGVVFLVVYYFGVLPKQKRARR